MWLETLWSHMPVGLEWVGLGAPAHQCPHREGCLGVGGRRGHCLFLELRSARAAVGTAGAVGRALLAASPQGPAPSACGAGPTGGLER